MGVVNFSYRPNLNYSPEGNKNKTSQHPTSLPIACRQIFWDLLLNTSVSTKESVFTDLQVDKYTQSKSISVSKSSMETASELLSFH